MKIQLKNKLYYSIGEVAEAFQVNTSLIRFWEKEFDDVKPKKNAKGNRKFSNEDVQKLELIYYLVKERGFTLEGAKVELKKENKPSLSNFEIVKKLQSIKVELTELKRSLD